MTRNEPMVVVGQVAAFVVNATIFNVWGEHDAVWRYMLVVAVLPAFALFFAPRPRWPRCRD